MNMTCGCTLGLMAVAMQIKDVPEEVRDAIAARAAARGQSTQTYLRELLLREYNAERNREIFEALADHRSLSMSAADVVADVRAGRADDS